LLHRRELHGVSSKINVLCFDCAQIEPDHASRPLIRVDTPYRPPNRSDHDLVISNRNLCGSGLLRSATAAVTRASAPTP
jgi:hypothetical protein